MNPATDFLWASRLLCYPDAELKALAQGWAQARAETGQGADIPTPPAPAWASAFMQHVASTPLLALQEDFVRTFDLNAAASLYLTTHVYGDSPLQGRALAALLELYREGGCDPILGTGAGSGADSGAGAGADSGAGELPDYLPMMLEFLAMAPPWAATCLCEKFAPVAKNIAVHLSEAQSPWADMLQAVAEDMRHCVPPENAEPAENTTGPSVTAGQSAHAGQSATEPPSSREVSV